MVIMEELEKKIEALEKRISKIERFLENLPAFADLEDEEEAEEDVDELYEKAVMLVIQYDRASASMLQRRLQIGFNRAARILEQMEKNGVVGPSDGSEPREVLVNKEDLKNLLEKYKREKEEKNRGSKN